MIVFLIVCLTVTALTGIIGMAYLAHVLTYTIVHDITPTGE